MGSDGVVDALNLNFSELVDFDRVNHILGTLYRSIGIQTADNEVNAHLVSHISQLYSS